MHFLRTAGHVELVRLGKDITWAVTPPSLVQVGEQEFVLISNSDKFNAIRRNFSNVTPETADISHSDLELPNEADFFPPLLKFRLNLSEAAQLARQFQLQLSIGFQDRLFAALPSQEDVLDAILNESENRQVFEPNSAMKFDFEQDDWSPYLEMTVLDPGFYRRQFEHSTPSYYVAVPTRSRRLHVLQIADPEWAWLVAFAKLSRKLNVVYRQSERKVSIFRDSEIFRLPTLIERALRSGTFFPPQRTSTTNIYSNISPRNLWQLVSKFPVFQVQIDE